MVNNKFFVFLKTEKQAGSPKALTDKDYPIMFQKVQSIPVVAEWVRNNPPNPNLDYKLPFQEMVNLVNSKVPKESMTPELMEANFGKVVKMLGGKPFEKGVKMPMFQGHAIWGIVNGYYVTKYNAEVARRN